MNIENLHKDEWIVITNPQYRLCGLPMKILAIQHPNLLGVQIQGKNNCLILEENMRITKCNQDFINAVGNIPPQPQVTMVDVHSWGFPNG